jgi:membrane protein implicated in regulation of membrane protease activity
MLLIDPVLLVLIILVSFICLGLLVWAIVRGQFRKIETGEEGLVGKTAIVKVKLKPKGMVLLEGELWNATIDTGSAELEDEVIVKKVKGLRVFVTMNKNEVKEK